MAKMRFRSSRVGLGRGAGLAIRSLFIAFISTLFGFLGNMFLFPKWGFAIPATHYLWLFVIVLMVSLLTGWRGIIYSPLVGIISATAFIFVAQLDYGIPILVLAWLCHAVIISVAVFIVNTFIR